MYAHQSSSPEDTVGRVVIELLATGVEYLVVDIGLRSCVVGASESPRSYYFVTCLCRADVKLASEDQSRLTAAI